MGRRHDEDQTRQNRTRRYEQGGYDGRNDERRGGPREGDLYGPHYDRAGNRYYEDDRRNRYYDEDFEDRNYYRDRDREREYYHREREQRQETRRTGMMVVGAICVAIIALFGVMAVTGDDSSQTSGDVPQQQPAPQQAPEQQPQAPSPQAPAAPQQDGASSEQVEGMRASIERQLAELRQSINQLRLEIWSFFGAENDQQQGGSDQ